jgi:hypothetical protein
MNMTILALNVKLLLGTYGLQHTSGWPLWMFLRRKIEPKTGRSHYYWQF